MMAKSIYAINVFLINEIYENFDNKLEWWVLTQ